MLRDIIDNRLLQPKVCVFVFVCVCVCVCVWRRVCAFVFNLLG